MAEVNELIGGYKLRNLLQSGQVSQVFEVVEPTSNRHFAMKILLPEHAANPEHRKTLFNEAEIGVKMRHENVINIIKVNRDEKNPHFIMEYFPAGSLRGRMKPMSKDPRDQEFVKAYAKRIFKQLATGLAYMNSSGYVHRDVKPDNVLVNALGQTKIIDFAISKKTPKGFLEQLMYKKGPVQGTHSYMSPEQIRNEKLDGRMDIYSYGATIYELACGRPPFRASSLQELLNKNVFEKPSPLAAYNPDVTDEFSALVLKLLMKKKEDRPATFHDVLMLLKKVRVFKSIPDMGDDEQRLI